MGGDGPLAVDLPGPQGKQELPHGIYFPRWSVDGSCLGREFALSGQTEVQPIRISLETASCLAFLTVRFPVFSISLQVSSGIISFKKKKMT